VTDDDRQRIAREAKENADTQSRIASLERDVGQMKAAQAWGIRALIGAVVYLGMQLWDFIKAGGVLK